MENRKHEAKIYSLQKAEQSLKKYFKDLHFGQKGDQRLQGWAVGGGTRAIIICKYGRETVERALGYSGILGPEHRSPALSVPGKIQDQMLRDPRWRVEREALRAPMNSGEPHPWGRMAGWGTRPPGG